MPANDDVRGLIERWKATMPMFGKFMVPSEIKRAGDALAAALEARERDPSPDTDRLNAGTLRRNPFADAVPTPPPTATGDEALTTMIFEAIGEASMCWSETPRGIFESTRAKAIGDRIVAALRQRGEEMAAIREQLAVMDQLNESSNADFARLREKLAAANARAEAAEGERDRAYTGLKAWIMGDAKMRKLLNEIRRIADDYHDVDVTGDPPHEVNCNPCANEILAALDGYRPAHGGEGEGGEK